MGEGNIFLDGTLVDVDVSYWSGAKVLTPEDLGLTDTEVAEAFHLGRKFLVPEAVIHGFRVIEARARRIVETSSFPFPIGNARFVPRKKFPNVLSKLKEYQTEYLALVENLITNYQSYRDQMLPMYEQAAESAWMRQNPDTKAFGIDYNPEEEKARFVLEFKARIASFYPVAESLRNRFALDWNVYEIAIPRLRETTGDLVANEVLTEGRAKEAEEEYRSQMRTKVDGFVNDVVTNLRSQASELASRVLNNIKEGKIVKSSTLESLGNFIDQFRELNFVGDKTVEEQLASLKKDVLDKYSTEDLKEGEPMEAMKRKLGEIIEATSNVSDLSSVTGQYKRKISWD
jgi:hypothetical protein